ncbi:PAAR domain-containing protein [Pseudomonas sp. PSE14]|uniref:PAAR domain-containing protein n=1 Tax=Pseudomonas sp. PSE14 TaxID=3016341 RepID=UPI0031F2E71D
MGRDVACKGDRVRCALHGVNEIAEGDEASRRNGRPIALHGHRCLCGCTLISSLPNAGRG